MKNFWKNFFTGLLVLLPAFVTFTIVRIVFGWIYGLVIGPIAQLFTPWMTPGWTVVLVKTGILVSFFVVVTLIGFGTRILVLRRFFSMAEAFMRRIPIVGKIYNATREITDTFQGAQKGAFNRVVFVEWPRKGLYTFGFVTSEGKADGNSLANVFVPTSPNPTTGFLILVEPDQIIPTDVSVEEAMKLTISGGVVGPEVAKPLRNPE